MKKGLTRMDEHTSHELAYKKGYEQGKQDAMKRIPVTERLPEDDLPKDTKRKQIRCLVATDKGTVKPCVRQRCISRKEKCVWVMTPWEWNKNIFAKPTHWMPLPEPPKGE
jgi:hypothetical protein